MLDWKKLKKTLKKSITEKANESIVSIKNSIIDALKDKNLKFQNKIKKLEGQLLELDQESNILDQFVT